MHKSVFVSFILLIFSLASATAGPNRPPHLIYIFPAGGQLGTTVDVTLAGNYLDSSAQLLTRGKDLIPTTPRVTVLTLDGKDGQATIEEPTAGNAAILKIAEDASAGFHELRVTTNNGVSNPRRFMVGKLPEIIETEPNDSVLTAEKLQAPLTINGQVSTPEDVDYFQFFARKGERFIFRVDARRLGSPLAAVLNLYSEDGNLIESGENFSGRDPLLDYTFEHPGNYIIRIHDIAFKGSMDCVYRLSMGMLPHIDFVLPAGFKRGEKTNVLIHGRNLPNFPRSPAKPGKSSTLMTAGKKLQTLVSELFVPEESIETERSIRLDTLTGSSNGHLLQVSDLPERLESENNNHQNLATKLEFPCGVTGQLSSADDVDFFRVKLPKGLQISMEVYSQRLGYPTDCTLELLSPDGKSLAQNDDNGGPDPRIIYTPPEEGDYILKVQELRSPHRRGPNFVYRLEIRPTNPELVITASEAFITVAKGSATLLTIQATRQSGITEPIALEVDGLPEGISITPVNITEFPGSLRIPKNNNRVQWILTADEAAPISASIMNIRGTTQIKKPDGSFQTLSAMVKAKYMAVLHSPVNKQPTEPVETTSIAIAIAEPPLFWLEAPEEVTTRKGEEIGIPVIIHRQEGFNDPIRLESRLNPIGTKAAPGVNIPGDSKEAVFKIYAVPPQVLKGTLILLATSKANESPTGVQSPMPYTPVVQAGRPVSVQVPPVKEEAKKETK